MKNYLNQNYYELLEISPEANVEEITRAYHTAQEAFNSDSVAVYSLFEHEEDREKLLARIQEAYRILCNGRTRREYDRELEQGRPWPEAELRPDPEPDRTLESLIPMEPLRPRLVVAPPPPPLEPPQAEMAGPGPASVPPPEPVDLLPGQPVSGPDLARLRESRGLSREQIFLKTRINQDLLAALESDHHSRLPARVYVKGFLKAYGRAIGVDPEALAEAYLAGWDQKD